MSTPLIDTLRVTKDLQSSGFDIRQSEGIVAAIETSLESGVATKADLGEVRADLKSDVAAVSNDLYSARAEHKADIAELKAELKADIAKLEVKIPAEANKVILAVIAVAAVAIGALKLL